MEMPVLNPQFFHDHAPSLEFFHQWKETCVWSPQILPIYQWQGILFIGVSGNSTPEVSVPHVFVQVEAMILESLWNKWQEKIEPIPTPSTEEFSFESMTEEVPAQSEGNNESNSSSVEEPLTEMPEGFSFESAELPTPQIQKDSEPQVEGLSLNAEVEVSSIKPITLVSNPMAETSVPTAALKSPVNDETTPLPIARTSANISPKISGRSEVSQLTPQNTNLEVNDVFEKLNAHFRVCMIFLINGQVAKPWKWTEGFKVPDKILNYDMSLPSPLRVVYRTSKSYYGPVKENPVLNEFSQAWLQVKIPTDLAISPLLVNDQLVGAVLCDGNVNPDSLEPLKFLEKVAAEVSARLEKNPAISQAA